MRIKSENEAILNEWKKRSITRGEGNVAEDGLHCKGKFEYLEGGYWSRMSGDEEMRWVNSNSRILFITKDLNDDEAWDIRKETGRKNHTKEVAVTTLFYKNMMRIVYGLVHAMEDGHAPSFDEANNPDNFIPCFENAATARINCKKQVGGATIANNTLKNYISAYADLLARQILLLDANIIVCCGGSSCIKDFVKETCYKDLIKVNDWIYYSIAVERYLTFVKY
ncbi:MAG: hypothetical protein Q4D41_12345 [Prevotellaceae bacterium]|nr:hypothetical protein [Prevotellaceae bacterium]